MNLNKSILIVDDDTQILNLLSKSLTKSGYICYCRNSIEDAVLLFKNNAIDLVISDICMPNGDGLELISNLKNLNTNLQFIFLTGYPDYKADKVSNLKPLQIIYKPISINLLVKNINTTLQ